MSLEQPSKIFFLIGCSNSKAGPDDVYRPESEAVRPGFSRSLVTEPLRDRKNVFDLLQRSRAKWAGIQLLALPYNRELRIGPDVKLRARPESRYLQARHLYRGRLYRQVEPETWKNRLHHVLIFSALYGLVRPEEQLQRYSLSPR